MIDPRPYTYEYRKPRLNNPTYQSSNLYESLYHLRIPSKNEYFLPKEQIIANQNKYQLQAKQLPRQQYNPEKYQPRQSEQRYEKIITRQQSQQPRQRQPIQRSSTFEKYSNQRASSRQQKLPGIQSHLSNYGQNLMKGANFDRFSVFQKQQKGYNIINCYPKQMSNSLRVFPKYTLEDKLIERGRYWRN